jgi:hypothetical protein
MKNKKNEPLIIIILINLISYLLLLIFFCRLVDRPSPPKREGLSLHKSADWSHLTRQSFDAEALASPPLSLSQHLSHSKDVPMTLPQVSDRHGE